ncbi:uncharacterized protein LOC110644002 [Hevea brasiliensis]|uniref:uncharacterized protein LOC110644002 n=1 Tax=Hevea brasiliensis TaxID=3981 RepID=UPI0025F93253|nr:uncharacterized protein LOC110644002 [Hevea brasiliensis]
MSASQSDREISKFGGRVDHHHYDDDDDDDEEEDKHGAGSSGRGSIDVNKKNNGKEKEKKQRSGYGCEGNFAKAKEVVLLQFTMVKKYLKHRWANSNKRPSPSSSSSANATTRTERQPRLLNNCSHWMGNWKQPYDQGL